MHKVFKFFVFFLRLCDGQSNTFNLLSLSNLPQLWKYAWGQCPFGRLICNQALTSCHVLRCCFNISTYFSSLSIPSILGSAPVPPAAKHPHNMMLPSPCFTVGMVFFSLQASLFISKHNNIHYSQTNLFLFRPEDRQEDQRTFLENVRSLSPCAVANRSLDFFMAVLEQWHLPC